MSLLYRPFVLSSRSLLFQSVSSQIFSVSSHLSHRNSYPLSWNPRFYPSRPTSFHCYFSTSSSTPPESPSSSAEPKLSSSPESQAPEAPPAEPLTPEQEKLAALAEKRAQAKLAHAKKEEKKKKKEEEKEKAKAQRKSKKELELIAQVERLRAGRVQTVRKWLKPENLVPPSYVWGQEKIFNYFLSHPTLYLAPDENKNTIFVPGQPLSHPGRSLQRQTRGVRWLKMNNPLFHQSPWNELLAVKAKKHRIFQSLGFEIAIPPPPEDNKTNSLLTPSVSFTEGHRSVINLRMSARDPDNTPILCNDTLSWKSVSSPPQISFEPIFPEKPSDSFYSLFLFDVDYPTHVFPDLSPMVLWQVSNIRDCEVEKGETIYEYLPPLPPPNSGPHRCVFLLCKQLQGLVDVSKETRISSTTVAGRTWGGVNLSQFLKKHQLEVQSFRYYRIYWSEGVKKHYKTLRIPEPDYFCQPELLPHKKMKIPGIPGRLRPSP